MAVRIIVTVLILAAGVGAGYYLYWQEAPICAICRRPLHGATNYRLFLTDGGTVDVCCPRCGLRFQMGRQDVLDAEVADFTTGERFPAREAFYVENSEVQLCCLGKDPLLKDRSGDQFERTWDRCLPSLVAFRSRGEAEVFAREKGGVVKEYRELTKPSSVGR